ncbi:MAG TPA: hypothetical protein VEI02_11955, partial [Planctomycetota bacterium]|nr:hypothetical protein [Planctomycetota bacterium]
MSSRLVLVVVALSFVAPAALAQQEAALRAEIERELRRPPSDDPAALEQQVLKLQALLRVAATRMGAAAEGEAPAP